MEPLILGLPWSRIFSTQWVKNHPAFFISPGQAKKIVSESNNPVKGTFL
jgi:hypothetical protein